MSGCRIPVDFTINIEERNNDNYLSAGEMPLPALYEMLCILFFLTGCFWVFILKKNGTEQVFRSVDIGTREPDIRPNTGTGLFSRAVLALAAHTVDAILK